MESGSVHPVYLLSSDLPKILLISLQRRELRNRKKKIIKKFTINFTLMKKKNSYLSAYPVRNCHANDHFWHKFDNCLSGPYGRRQVEALLQSSLCLQEVYKNRNHVRNIRTDKICFL